MPLFLAIRCRAVKAAGALVFVALAGCGEEEPREADIGRAEEPSSVDELAPLLASAGGPGLLSEADRRVLEQAMQRVLLPAADRCEGCAVDVSYVDESAGDYFRCLVRGPSGDPVAELHVFHRAPLPLEAAASWGRATVAGYPASGLPGEHIFVWPGRFEIRAFARSESLRRAGELERLVESLPLRALARL